MTDFKQFFTVDSDKRSSGSHHSFTYNIRLPSLPGGTDTKGYNVVCTAASIPKSWYLIPAGRNTFTLTENGTAITITVPPGNYNINNFITTVIPLMNAASLNGSVYAMTVNTINGKYTMTVTGAGPSSITMPGANGAGIHDQFGLNANTTTALPFTSPNTVSFSTLSAVQIHSDIVTGGDDLLQTVFAAENPAFSSIVYVGSDLNARSRRISSKVSSSFYFRLADSDGNTIDTNGRPLVLTLMVYRTLDEAILSYIALRADMIVKDFQMSALQQQQQKEQEQRRQQQQLLLEAPPLPPQQDEKQDLTATAPADGEDESSALLTVPEAPPAPEPPEPPLSGAKFGAVTATGL